MPFLSPKSVYYFNVDTKYSSKQENSLLIKINYGNKKVETYSALFDRGLGGASRIYVYEDSNNIAVKSHNFDSFKNVFIGRFLYAKDTLFKKANNLRTF